jgi:hypothetical protein
VNLVSDLEAALSFERFGRYVKWAEGDKARALELYTLNTTLSEALYTPLHGLELALRNRIHNAMCDAYCENWFEDGIVTLDNQRKQVAEALSEISKGGVQPTPGKIIAKLSFSFWTTMLSGTYEDLWRATLHKIASKPDGKSFARKDLSRPLGTIRTLRNRIAHHEPIIYWDLRKWYAEIMDLTVGISPAVAQWCQNTQKFLAVFPEGGYALHNPESGKPRLAAAS